MKKLTPKDINKITNDIKDEYEKIRLQALKLYKEWELSLIAYKKLSTYNDWFHMLEENWDTYEIFASNYIKIKETLKEYEDRLEEVKGEIWVKVNSESEYGNNYASHILSIKYHKVKTKKQHESVVKHAVREAISKEVFEYSKTKWNKEKYICNINYRIMTLFMKGKLDYDALVQITCEDCEF